MTLTSRVQGVLAPVVSLSLCVGILLSSVTARAFEPFALQVPCRATATNSVGTVRPCITCHNNPDGGSGCDTPPCQNAFGMAFDLNGKVWDADLAMMDSDGDGYTNGEELGDPEGTWTVGMASPSLCDCASPPGWSVTPPGGTAGATPADTDADMDGVCCRGSDTNGNGNCLDPDEDGAAFDCDDDDDTVSSTSAELCTDPGDNDCDGLATLVDPDCEMFVDRDGDGYCRMGVDTNRDRDCLDTGEMTSEVDCDDDAVTVSPAAREFCIDGLDNDCDGDVDTDDDECTSDVDADEDGYCPIGRDLDGNGNCNDPGEIDAGFDCDDSEMSVNPGATEICTDFRDNDCDGLADFRDSVDCGEFFDADGDGYCPTGRDVNGNGNCTDEGEAAEPGDCNDDAAAINPGMLEVCTNGAVDDDCDLLASLADPDCAGYIDTDGDSYCFVGADMDGDGTCTGEGEASGDGDCDEADAAVNPTAVEVCTDGIDNDCDGSPDAADRVVCADYRDVDGDSYCVVGMDMNADGDCADAGEQGGASEWTGEMDPHTDDGTEGRPTRYPGAPEHCFNMIDEDLDGEVDEAGYCSREVDADGDGWCPIGQDIDGDGSCTGPGENVRATDCNDGDAMVSPGEEERCLELVDANCDGYVGTDDPSCFYLLDRDGDGICGEGTDDNRDGDCLDLGEDRFGRDCDDADPAISSRAMEVCDDEVDNNCNGNIDQADAQCMCTSAAMCDDGDPCTMDTCGGDGNCAYAPDATCGDAGMQDGGTMTTTDDCNCMAPGARHTGGRGLIGLLLVGLAFLLRRRR